MTRGVWKERNGWLKEHSVRIQTTDGTEVDIAGSEYTKSGYAPPFELLPWKEELPRSGLESAPHDVPKPPGLLQRGYWRFTPLSDRAADSWGRTLHLPNWRSR